MINHDLPSPYLLSTKKKWFDIVVAGAAAAITAPVEAGVALRLRHDLDAGSVYFKQERANGIVVNKLRTLLHRAGIAEVGSVRQNSSLHDPRIPSAFAAFVRNSRLDETPQFRQVVGGVLRSGEPRLSVVGIRPLLAEHVEEFYEAAREKDEQLADRWRYKWVPEAPHGIISAASVHNMGRTSNEGLDLYEWVRMEDEYCRTATMGTDLKLVAAAGQGALHAVMHPA